MLVEASDEFVGSDGGGGTGGGVFGILYATLLLAAASSVCAALDFDAVEFGAGSNRIFPAPIVSARSKPCPSGRAKKSTALAVNSVVCPSALFRYLNQPDVFQRVYSAERVVRPEIHHYALCGALRIVIALGINDDTARHYCRFHLALRIEEDLGMRSLRVRL